MLRHLVGAGFLLGMLVLVACVPDRATTEANDAQSKQQAVDGATSSTTSSVKVYMDPTTGEIRDPTAAEVAAETALNKQAQSSKEIKAPREIVHADGSREVLLDPSASHSLQGCLQIDGSLVMDHDCNSAKHDSK